jgi:hypothetical protein
MHPLIYEVLPSQEERYPVDADCYAPTGEDRGLCDQRLRNESLGLFQVAGGGVNLMWSIRDDGKTLNLKIKQSPNIGMRMSKLASPAAIYHERGS